MIIQMALDRMEISEAIRLVEMVEPSIGWIEVGTSLIKEFGMPSIKEIKEAYADKPIVADIKTIDNARYEFERCFQNGADIATVMGVSPLVTIEACIEVAQRFNKQIMIDLLNTSEEQKRALMKFNKAIFCYHVSKDEQEESGNRHQRSKKSTCLYDPSLQLAVAGGITLDSLETIKKMLNPSIVIIGSAITKAKNPSEAAATLKQKILQMEEE